MLNRLDLAMPGVPVARPARQRGVVLLIALIILVALTIGGLTLIRSVDTTNMISGNLAFRQAATRSGEAGTEMAIQRFLATAPYTTLWNHDFTQAYSASSSPISSNANAWEAQWSLIINPNNVVTPGQQVRCSNGAAGGGRVCVLPADITGNIVSYTIERLCRSPGDPTQTSTSACVRGAQDSSLFGENLDPTSNLHLQPSQYFYRITTRVLGPRNTSSYIQTIVAR